jgi:hypothetical protein
MLASLMVVSSLFLFTPQLKASTRVAHSPILIGGNSDFTASNGVTGGTGTFSDPYIISGWSINASVAGAVCIHIVNTSAYFIIKNVQVECGWFDTTSAAVKLQSVSNGQILSSSIQGWGESGEIDSSTNILFSNNQVFTEGGANTPSYGFSITGVTNSTISGNTFGPAPGGQSVHISNSRNDLFSGNTIYPGGCGAQACTSGGPALEIDYSSLITVQDNQMSNGAQCVFSLNYDLSLQILNNTLQGGDVACVVALERTNSTLISGNLIGPVPPVRSSIWQTVDLSIYSSENDLVARNNITAEYQGILLTGDTGISVFHNNIINNKVQATDDSPALDHWDNGYPSGGNYWSDYTGSDPDNDGIGDTAYSVCCVGTVDRNPLMRPFVASPLISVVEGLDGNLYSSTFKPDGSWNGWESLSGSSPSTPALCRSGPDRVDLVVRGNDDAIYHKTFSSGVWSASWDKNPTGVTIDQPTCAVLGTTLYVVVRGATSELWATTFDLNTNMWAPSWTDLLGFTQSVPGLAATPTLNRLDLVVRGFDNRIYHKSLISGAWSQSWDSPSGGTIGAPVAVSDGSSLHVVVVGGASSLWYNSLSLSSNTWTGWVYLSGSTSSTPSLVRTPGLDRLDLVVRGMDNGLYHKSLVNGVWSSTWDTLNGLTSNAPAAASDGTTLRVEVVGMDDSLVYDSLPLTAGSWSGWAGMTGASTLTPSLG